MDGVRLLVYRSSLNGIPIILLIQWSILLYRVGFFVCAILGGHFKVLYYIRSINTPYIYILIWGLCVAYMGYGYKAMLIWWYIYVCVVYDLLYNIMGTYKGWLYNKGTYNRGEHMGGVYIA